MAEYISRKVLENVMAIMAVSGTEKDYHVWARAISLLYDVPNVDVAPVEHGRWNDNIDGITPYCSVCGRTHGCVRRTPAYCPNCGAKMDLEEQNNA